MIPKKIHYCWFGGNEMSVLNQRCIESWKKYCPEYELVLWNEENSNIDNEYCAQAVRQKNWAFVADWVRFEVLHEYGGIYFDTDIELIQPLSKIITRDVFYSAWESANLMGAGFIACLPGDLIMKRACELITENLIPLKKFATSPRILKRAVDDQAGNAIIDILQPPSFYPFNPFDENNPLNAGQLLYSDITDETIGIHHYSSSWHFKKNSGIYTFLKNKLKRHPDWRLTIDF